MTQTSIISKMESLKYQLASSFTTWTMAVSQNPQPSNLPILRSIVVSNYKELRNFISKMGTDKIPPDKL